MSSQLPRQSAFQLLGLITEPNEFGVYPPGACRVAQNVLFRSPGLCTSARDANFLLSVGNPSSVIHKIIPTEGGNYLSLIRDAAATGYHWTPFWQNNYGFFGTSLSYIGSVNDTTGLLSSTGFISSMVMRGKLFVNTPNRGVMLWDKLNPAPAEMTSRPAGLPQPTIYLHATTTANAGALPAGTLVGYAVVFRRVLSDGYEIVSPPSPILKYWNGWGGSTYVDPTIGVRWRDFYDLLEGDIVELYRSNGYNFASAGYNNTPDTTLRLVRTTTVTAAQVTARTLTLIDKQPCVAPLYETYGRELYTNPFQEGAAGAYRNPPGCRCMATFNGHAFYGNITDRAIAALSVPAGAGVTHALSGTATAANTAFHRINFIGERRGAGTVTNGSPTITGVSATDILGITVGQQWSYNFTGFDSSARVQSVGATSITMNQAAFGAASEFRISDVLEVNGQTYLFSDPATLYWYLGATGTPSVGFPAYEVGFSTILAFEQQQTYSGAGFSMSLEPGRPGFPFDSITVRGTNGQNYSPPIPLLTQTVKTFTKTQRANILQWSLQDQPEHCPVAGGPTGITYTPVGSGAIVNLQATRDALWIWCTDGLYRLTGLAGDFRVDLIDPQLIICAPGAAITMHDTCYAYTNRGFVSVNDLGIKEISQGAIADILPGPSYEEATKYQLHKDETNDEVYLLVQGALGAPSTLYCYNARTSKFSTLVLADQAITGMAFMQYPSTPGQEGYPLITTGDVGRAPFVYQWPGTGTPRAPQVLLQPFYADSPWIVKDWLDTTWIFDEQDHTNVVVPTFNDSFGYGSGGVLISNGIDARANFWPPRSKGKAPSIQPGFYVSTPTRDLTIKGCSIRFKPLTTQQEKR